MNKKNKKPKIRFPEYTGDWEQRKLGEVTKELSEYDNFSSGLPLLTSARTGLMYQSDYRGNTTTDNENTLFSVVPLNACTYRHMSDDSTFHLNINTLEKGLVSREYPVFVENESNLKFIVQYVNSSSSFVKFCTEQKKGGTRTRLYYKTLCEYQMMMPLLDEQNKIADYFTNLDNLITLHQCKCDSLVTFKKAMLSKMFPKNGETTPEIRFPEFTDDWEQRKFGDVGSVAMCKRIFKEQTSSVGDIPFYKIGTFGGEPDAYIDRKLFDEYKSKFSYPQKGDILVSASGTIGRTVEYTGADEYFQDSNIVWLKHTDEIENDFLRILYEIVEWNGIEGTTIKRLYNENFLSTEFMLPSVLEQKKIGDYFRNLDNLITLHQRKCDKYKELKKALLQQMFV